MNILKWQECKDQIIECLRNETLIPILGSGFSYGAKTSNKGIVPTGKQLKEHMISEIANSGEISTKDMSKVKKKNFRDVCTYYETDNIVPETRRRSYWKKNFKDAIFDKNAVQRKFLDISWPYIYTLNIDDAIENSSIYNTVIVPKRMFRDDVFNEHKCVIKLHGDISELVKYADGTKVFTSREYLDSLNSNQQLLNKLKTDYSNNNIIFIGCSLDDELDLLLTNSLQIQFKKKESETRIYYCTNEVPSSLTQFDLQAYGVTDVIVFDSFSDIYVNMHNAWETASLIQESQLSSYKAYKIQHLGSGKKDREENKEYFLWAKNPANIKKREITIPYYFVKRHEVDTLLPQLKKHILHIISGTGFSGLTYMLVAIYARIKDRRVYYFDCLAKLADSALLELLKQENAVLLFDNKVVTRKQMEIILDNLQDVCNRKNDIVIIDNSNHLTGLIDIYTRESKIDETQYHIYQRIKGNMSDLEINEVNNRLSAINIPLYTAFNQTFLDHLSSVQNELHTRGKFDNIHILCDTTEKLSVFIALAVKQVLYSSSVNELAITGEIEQIVNQCAPFIEKVTTNQFERDPSDLSYIKYICNSSYWLKKELSEFLKTNGVEQIVEAYDYIISQIIRDVPSLIYAREKYRSYIEFDSIYDIFKPYAIDKIDNYQLGRSIYERLQTPLGQDYHFMHQKAKCYFRSALNDKNATGDAFLITALESIATAKSKVMIEMAQSTNPLLHITYDHILFTQASILCEKCNRENYSSMENLGKAIDLVYEAIMSPNNTREIKDNMNIASRSITATINAITVSGVLNGTNAEIKRKASSILTRIAQAR